jgi:CDP-glycerol glycerophosphotransferase
MVSIIIPVYNGKKYLEQVISCCIEQTYKNIDILVIDDGSTDNPDLNRISQMDNRIRVFSKKNEGLGPTRNFGIQHAKGQYIFFLDVDDIIPNNSIQLLREKIEKKDIVIGLCQRIFYDKKENIIKSTIWKEKIYSQNINNVSDLIPDTIATNKLYRKKFLLQNNIFFLPGLYEDKLFILKVFTHLKNYSIVDKVVYQWRIEANSNSITNQITIKNLEARMNSIYQCLNYLEEKNIPHIKERLIKNTITHDLKIYVNHSCFYSLKELKQLYSIYSTFIQKYKNPIKTMSFNINKKTINTIPFRYHTISEFLKISYKKNNSCKKNKYHTIRNIILKILLKLEKLRMNK